MRNTNLIKAKNSKYDEFYTDYDDIQRQIEVYVEFNPDVFRDKIILMPCDNPQYSNFTKYFIENFERFKLKKLINTSYNLKGGKGKILIKTDNNDLPWQYLQGDGDFNSLEITKFRDEADMIITNPPFSLFRDFLNWVVQGKKQFILIGSLNVIGFKEVFPLIKNNQMWLGGNFQKGNAHFMLPSKEIIALRSCCWYTNIDYGKRHHKLRLMSIQDNLKFSKHKQIIEKGYEQYDNYNAIEVSFTDAIPNDYDGIMGVPISFLQKYSPEQFEIIGNDYDINQGNLPDLVKQGWTGKLDRGYINGNRIYCRLFIKNKILF